MSSQNRVLLFCMSLLLAPVLYWAGDEMAGLPIAVLLPSLAVMGTLLYAKLPERHGTPPKERRS